MKVLLSLFVWINAYSRGCEALGSGFGALYGETLYPAGGGVPRFGFGLDLVLDGPARMIPDD
jgi:hypothetical protein